MKKVLAAAAAAILCFSLSACGTSKQEGNGNGVTYTYKDQTITMKAALKEPYTAGRRQNHDHGHRTGE